VIQGEKRSSLIARGLFGALAIMLFLACMPLAPSCLLVVAAYAITSAHVKFVEKMLKEVERG
jgi:hypothetical protein